LITTTLSIDIRNADHPRQQIVAHLAQRLTGENEAAALDATG
jgi:hypothetical protein